MRVTDFAVRPASPSIRETAAVFLRLGTTAFGGPAAHIALMEDEVVTRRGWLSREQFLDYLGATNLIPGPNSTELAIHIGLARHGLLGLAIAGGCFIAPAALIVTAIAWAYARYGTLPAVVAVFNGITPVVLAVIAQALWKLGQSAIKSLALAVVALLSVVALGAGAHELAVLLVAGCICGLMTATTRVRNALVLAAVSWARVAMNAGALDVGVAATASAPFSLWTLFTVFAKIGSVLFGSGYVLVAFLRADFVDRLGWITERQLLDAIAVGQVTPGPVFTTATFVGYLVGGLSGAIVATLGIFLPAFAFVAISGPLVPRIRESRVAGAVLDGVNVASLALVAVVTWDLGRRSFVGIVPALIGVAALVALVRYRINAVWLVAGGAIVGLIVNASAFRP